MAPDPPRAVLDWLNDRDSAELHLSTISVAEIGYGLRALPGGRRRASLEDRFETFTALAFEHRILAFDLEAARIYPDLMIRRRRAGRPMSSFDGQIAAIARAHGLAVATRNVRDFEDCGIDVIDPFSYQP